MHGQYKDAQCIDALSEVACNMLRNHVPQGSCRTPSSPHSKQPTASVYSGDPDWVMRVWRIPWQGRNHRGFGTWFGI